MEGPDAVSTISCGGVSGFNVISFGLAVVSLCLMSCDELTFRFFLKMFLTGDLLLALDC